MTEAIILAGGFGTRLQTVVSDVPKPMAPVNGRPFLDYMFLYLRHYGITHVVMSTGYLAHKVSDRYKQEFEGIRVSYAVEETPLGTGGGIRLAMQQCNTEDILVLNGDSFFDVDLTAYAAQYGSCGSGGALALRSVENAARYGTITLGSQQRIEAFKEKDSIEKPGLINGGVYLLNRNLFLEQTPATKAFSIEKDFFETQLSETTLCGFEHDGYFIDIGIPEDYSRAQDDFKEFRYKTT